MPISEWARALKGHYPDYKVFSGSTIAFNELRRFVALWMTEGIPFAFAECPFAFQYGRDLVATDLGIPSRDVSLTGSARIGFSLNPAKFGAPYERDRSDLDMFAVSSALFSKVTIDAQRFVADFTAKRISPPNDTSKRFWEHNVPIIRANIGNAFLDLKYVPNWDRYPETRKVNNAAWKFIRAVNEACDAELIHRCTIRVYRDWGAAVAQISFSLRRTLDKLASA